MLSQLCASFSQFLCLLIVSLLFEMCMVLQMNKIPQNPDAVYAFWVGFGFSTQYHILELCAQTPSVDTIAVFQDYKWTKPSQGQSLASAFRIRLIWRITM